MKAVAQTMKDDLSLAGGLGDDIRLPKLSHLVAGRLRDQIVSGKFEPGSLLAPEGTLLTIFNVSRPTLREALRILEAEGLISIGRGMRNGPTVLGPSIQKAVEYTSFVLVSEGVTMRDLHQARMFMEPAIIRSLTGEALKKTVVQLREHVQAIAQATQASRYIDVLAHTNRFHEALAKASGNKTIALLVGMLQTISDEVYAVTLSVDSSTPHEALHRNMSKTVTGYSALCDLLEKGKTDEAASYWRRYMERALEFLNRSKIGDRRLVSTSSSPGHSGDRNPR